MSWKSYLTFFWKPVLQYVVFPAQFLFLYSYHPSGHMGDLPKKLEAKWKEKHKIDAKTSKKAMYRLVTACEKTKKVLSANPEAPINIECFMEDIDVRGMMDRSVMLEVAEPFLVKLDALMEQALKASALSAAEVSSVEIIGGTCRIPAVKDRIATFFNKESCSTTLNLDECVARLTDIFKAEQAAKA